MSSIATCNRCGIPLIAQEIIELDGICTHCFTSTVGEKDTTIDTNKIKEKSSKEAKEWLLNNISKNHLLSFIELYPKIINLKIVNCPGNLNKPLVTSCIRKHLYSKTAACLACKPVKDHIVNLAIIYHIHLSKGENADATDIFSTEGKQYFMEHHCRIHCNFEYHGECDLGKIEEQVKDCMILYDTYGSTLWDVINILYEGTPLDKMNYVDSEYIEECIIHYLKENIQRDNQIKNKPALSFYRRDT